MPEMTFSWSQCSIRNCSSPRNVALNQAVLRYQNEQSVNPLEFANERKVTSSVFVRFYNESYILMMRTPAATRLTPQVDV